MAGGSWDTIVPSPQKGPVTSVSKSERVNLLTFRVRVRLGTGNHLLLLKSSPWVLKRMAAQKEPAS